MKMSQPTNKTNSCIHSAQNGGATDIIGAGSKPSKNTKQTYTERLMKHSEHCEEAQYTISGGCMCHKISKEAYIVHRRALYATRQRKQQFQRTYGLTSKFLHLMISNGQHKRLNKNSTPYERLFHLAQNKKEFVSGQIYENAKKTFLVEDCEDQDEPLTTVTENLATEAQLFDLNVRAQNTASIFNANFSEIITDFMSGIKSYFVDFPNASRIVSCISNLIIIIRNMSDPTTIACALINILSTMRWEVKEETWIMTRLNEVWDMLNKPVEKITNFAHRIYGQDGDDEITESYALLKYVQEHNVLGALCALGGLVVTLLTGFVLGKLPGKGTYDELMNRVKNLPGTIKSAAEINTFGTELTRTMIEAFKTNILGYDDKMFKPFERVEAWEKEIQAMMELDFNARVKCEAELQQKAHNLYKEGLKMAAEFELLKVPYASQTSFRNYLRVASELYKTAEASGASNIKTRQEPLCIQFFGGAGVGKTVLLNFVQMDLGRAMGLKTVDEVNADVYQRKIAQKHWDGYNAQKICVIDEYGAVKDSVGNANEQFLDLIHCMNTNPLPLPMAAIHDKANTYFTSTVLLLTSNSFAHNILSLDHPEAVTRRLEHRIRVHLRPEFSIPGDKQRYRAPANHAGQGFSTDGYLFDIVSPTNNMTGDKNIVYSHKNLQYDDMIAILIAAYRKKENKDTDLKASLSNYIAKPARKEETLFEIEARLNAVNPEQPPEILIEEDMDEDEQDGSLRVVAEVGLDRAILDMRLPEQRQIVGQATFDDYLVAQKKFEALVGTAGALNDMRELLTVTPQANVYNYVNNLLHRENYDANVHIHLADYIGSPVNPITNEQFDEGHQALDMVAHRLLYNLFTHDCFSIVRNDDSFPIVYNIYRARALTAYGDFRLFKRVLLATTPIDLLKQYITVCDGNCSNKWQILTKIKNVYTTSVQTFTDIIEKMKDKFFSLVDRDTLWDVSRTIIGSALIPLTILGIPMIAGLIYKLVYRLWQFCTGKTVCGWNETISDYNKRCKSTEKINLHVTYDDKPVYEGNYDPSKVLAKQNRPVAETYDVSKTMARRTVVVSEGNYDATKVKAKQNQVICEGSKDEHPLKKIAEGAIDQAAVQLIDSIMMKNQFTIEYMREGVWRFAGVITFVCGTYALVNHHVINRCLQFDKVRIRGEGSPAGLEFGTEELMVAIPPADHVIYGKRDVAIVAFPIRCRQFPDIRKHFASREDFTKFETVDFAVLVGYMLTGTLSHRTSYTSRVEATNRNIELYGGDEQIMGVVRDSFNYDVNTQKGDCGSLLICLAKWKIRKIIGMHCAGSGAKGKTGYSTPVSIEMINYLCNILNTVTSIEQQISCPELDEDVSLAVEGHLQEDGVTVSIVSKEPHKGSFAPCGTLPPGKGVFAKGVTNIQPSELDGVLVESVTKPAYLRPFVRDGKTIDPKKKAIEKGNVIPVHLPEKYLELANAYMRARHHNGDNTYRRLFTIEETIKGIEDDPLVKPIDRSTSAGWPYMLDRDGSKGKTKYLGSDENYIVDHPRVLADVAHIISEGKAGRRVPAVFVDTMKDERRPIAKVEEGKTRLFNTGSLPFNIVCKMYFGGWIAFLVKNKINHDSCVGINAYSTEWDTLAKHLLTKGNRLLAGDFSNYDGTIGSEILFAMCDDANDFYYKHDFTELEESQWREDCLVRKALMSSVIFSLHLDQENLYWWIQSQPSGNIFTVNLNSVVNTKYSIIAYMLCAEKYCPERANIQSYVEDICEVNYGDDNVKSVGPKAQAWYTMANLTEAYAKLGLVYTDEHKSVDAIDFRPLEEITFLKRGFWYDTVQMRWRAPLELQVVLEMAQWVKGNEDHSLLCASNLERAAYELAQHPRAVFEKHWPKFLKANAKLPTKALLSTYDIYQDQDGEKYLF